MARIRTIKPEFFTSEDIVTLSPLARLLYIALWCEADREGRLAWKPRTLKMKYLPADEGSIDPLCIELTECGLVQTYSVGGENFAILPTFRKHQAINVREAQSVIPAPPQDLHVHAREKDAWAVSADVRETVMARDGGCCTRCGSDESPQIDHIFPKSMGGTNALTNLRVLCRSCNSARPVAGQALIDDLAKDGLTLADMERTCMHVKVRGEGKGKEGKGKEGNKAAPVGELLAGVSPQIVADFTALRTRLRAPITATAVAGIRREAEQAGLTLEQALSTCCERGWRGFKAEWMAPKSNGHAAEPVRRRQLL